MSELEVDGVRRQNHGNGFLGYIAHISGQLGTSEQNANTRLLGAFGVHKEVEEQCVYFNSPTSARTPALISPVGLASRILTRSNPLAASTRGSMKSTLPT